MFADLHDHDNANLRVLALRELDRAPYDLLAALQFDPDADRILDAMVRPTMVEFRPIYTLLLGLSGDAAARAPLEQGLAEALALQTSAYIGAWAVALIEHQGMPAVDLLAEQLATNIHLRADTREALVEALTIQTAYGTPEMAARLDAIVADMLQRDPSSAGMIARQLASRGIWTQADRLEAMLKSGALTDLQSVISVSHYLSFARDIEAYEAQNSN